MTTKNGLSTLVGKTYEEAVTVGDWSKITACITRQFDASVALVGTHLRWHGDDSSAGESQPVVAAWHASGDRSLRDSYEVPTSLVREALALPPGRPLAKANISGDRNLSKISSVQQAIEAGLEHLLVMATGSVLDGSTFILVGRDRGQSPFSQPEMQDFQSLGQHIQRAVRIFDRVDAAAIECSPSVELDTIGFAIIFLDQSHKVVAVNRVAEELLATGDGIRLHQERVTADTDIDLDAAIRSISIAAVSAAPMTRPDPLFFPIRRDNREKLNAMLAMTPWRWNAFARESTTVLVISDPECRSLVSAAALRQGFDLTEAEARFLQSFMKTCSVAGASEALGIRIETGRHHLKSIFGKVGVHSQAELTRTLLRHPVALLGGIGGGVSPEDILGGGAFRGLADAGMIPSRSSF